MGGLRGAQQSLSFTQRGLAAPHVSACLNDNRQARKKGLQQEQEQRKRRFSTTLPFSRLMKNNFPTVLMGT